MKTPKFAAGVNVKAGPWGLGVSSSLGIVVSFAHKPMETGVSFSPES